MRLRPLLFLLPVIFLSACTGIPRGWSEAKRTPPADALSGAWTGTWRSDINGHHGGLRAVAAPHSPGVWQFRFRASWAKILCAGFTVDTAATRGPDGTWTLSGSKDLGPAFGGLFHCRGTVKDGVFQARYEAKLDRGVMEMRRAGRND
jgi:hypothetical protein